MYISAENILITLVLNGLIGVISGLWLRMPVLVPLVAITFLEAAFPTTTWMSALGWVVVLICSAEMCYLIGSACGAMWLPLPVRRFRRDFTDPRAH